MNTKELQPIQFLDVPYQEDLAKHYFAAIEAQPWSMLLKSSSLNHENGRFDILVSNPIATLVTHDSTTTLTHDAVIDPSHSRQETIVSHSQQDPFLLVESAIQDHIGPINYDSKWPFLGGALGYFAYDLGRRVEDLPELSRHDIHAPDMAVGIYDWL